MTEYNSRVLYMRVPVELYERVKNEAELESRTLAGMVKWMILHYFEDLDSGRFG